MPSGANNCFQGPGCCDLWPLTLTLMTFDLDDPDMTSSITWWITWWMTSWSSDLDQRSRVTHGSSDLFEGSRVTCSNGQVIDVIKESLMMIDWIFVIMSCLNALIRWIDWLVKWSMWPSLIDRSSDLTWWWMDWSSDLSWSVKCPLMIDWLIGYKGKRKRERERETKEKYACT